MSYTVRSSEKLRKSGSEAETKALLYLMNFRMDSDKIYYFVVDFFNDLTGMDSMASKLWDMQSKGAHNVGPNAIGKELVTLFKNYMSELSFEAYILFVGSVTGSLRKDSSIDIFGRSNIKESAIELIKNGLVEEGKDKEYIDNGIRMINQPMTIRKEEQYGKYVSLIPFSEKVCGVTLRGLKYPLTDYTMGGFNSLGISNEIVSDEATISFSSGELIVIESKD